MIIMYRLLMCMLLLLAWTNGWSQTPLVPPTCPSGQVPYVFEVALAAGSCSGYRVEVRDASNNEIIYSGILPTSQTSRVTRQIICIKESVTAVNWTLSVPDTGAPGCCIRTGEWEPCQTVVTQRGPYLIEPGCTHIDMGIGHYGEDAGNLSRFESVGISGCDTIRAGISGYCSPTGTGGYYEISEVQWFLVKSGDRRSLPNNRITAQTAIDIFGSVNSEEAFTVVARDVRTDPQDGTVSIIEYPPSRAFNIRSPAPQLTLSSPTPSICTTPGSIRINASTISNAINAVQIQILDEQGVAIRIPNHGDATSIAFQPAQLNNQVFNLDPGSYSLRAMNINNTYPNDNCVTYYDFTIAHNEYTMAANPQVTNETCSGSSDDGAITLTDINGQSPYTFIWRKNSNPGAVFPNNASITAIAGGDTYDVTIKDTYGCTGQVADIQVTEPDAVVVNSGYAASHVSCHPSSITGPKSDGQITIEAEGGTGSLYYSLTGDSHSRPYQTAASFTGLPPDLYTINVKDDNDCVVTYSTQVTLSHPSVITYDAVDKNDITCTGTTLSEGSMTIFGVSGGAGNYAYSINGTSFQGSDEFRFLPAGTYTIQIKDDNECVVEAEPVTIISEALGISLIDQENLICSDYTNGTATITVAGGHAPYTISWPDGQSSLTATNLTKGDHTVTVSDNNGCEGTTVVTIGSPEPLTVAEQITSPTCAEDRDGSIEVIASGGNSGYIYQWGDGENGANRTNLPVGTYHLTVMDQEGCEAQYDVMLTPPPQASLGEDKAICPGQPVLMASNLSGSYAWSADNGFTSTDYEVSVTEPGVYKLVVIDNNGCRSEDQITITQSLDLLNADFLLVSEAHAGDTLIAIDITWPIPENVTWILPSQVNGISTDGDIAEIAFDETGVYDITMVANLGGCADQYTKQINILEPRDNSGGRQATRESLIQDVKLYPNPSSGLFNLQVQLRDENNIKVSVLTSDGNRTLITMHDKKGSSYNWDFNLSHLVQGLYFIVIESGRETKALRLIKY